ncbi:hypothetical protein RAM80_16190 [Pseudomonas sp. App30]|uniref:hypothetical protein n=1 Tax=Pseudomonas sp. App30 TaxID=3068990 RepID=UPI003A80D656
MTYQDASPPIFLINPDCPDLDLFEFATRRFQTVRNLMESLSCMNSCSIEGKDLNVAAEVSYHLLQEGCEVLEAMHKKLAL